MDKANLDPKIAAELSRLALLSDDEIDTSDIPEISDWSHAIHGRFLQVSLEERGYDVRAIANWVVDYLEDIESFVTNMSLNKLLYFIFERGIIEKKILFTNARVEAWNHGPVFREIYHALKGNDDNIISKKIEKYSIRDRENVEAREQFTSDDVDFFKSVIDDYRGFSAAQLRRISHREGGPWDCVWKSAAPVNPGMVISVGLICKSAPKKRDLDGRY